MRQLSNNDAVAMLRIVPSLRRRYHVNVGKISWDDIGSLEDVKKKLRQAVEWPIKYRHTFERLGLKPPNGILLYGPPGCSKTTLAKRSGTCLLNEMDGIEVAASVLVVLLNMPLNDDFDLNLIAKQAELYTGADLKNLCRESAIISLRETGTT
ncbi:13399_t:CDS:2, partial [Dentiscutata erythropus]